MSSSEGAELGLCIRVATLHGDVFLGDHFWEATNFHTTLETHVSDPLARPLLRGPSSRGVRIRTPALEQEA